MYAAFVSFLPLPARATARGPVDRHGDSARPGSRGEYDRRRARAREEGAQEGSRWRPEHEAALRGAEFRRGLGRLRKGDEALEMFHGQILNNTLPAVRP